MDTSPNLELPYLQAAQAQKHVTHNAALERLDLIVQLVLQGFAATNPPLSPDEGQVWALGLGATGDWAGQDGRLAAWANGGWLFIAPQPGWRAVQGNALRIWNGTDWGLPDLPPLQNLPGVGINTGSDATNKLAVASDAVLFSHVGAGHQVKINKNAAGDTASLLFQTNWDGHAEMGLAGDNDFSVKVSADGTLWTEALRVLAASGAVRFGAAIEAQAGSAAAPSLAFAGDTDTGLFRVGADQIGLTAGGVRRLLLSAAACQVDVPITGTAVQAAATDSTAGRLMAVGGFGLGAATSCPTIADLNDIALPAGLYRVIATTANSPAALGTVTILRNGATRITQELRELLAGTAGGPLRVREYFDGTWSAWRRVYTTHNLLGSVSQASGVPTGAVIERGSNANGEYVRFADGTQLCWCESGDLTADTAHGGIFRSSEVTLTYPAAFSATPRVAAGYRYVSGTGGWASTAAGGSTTTAPVRIFAALTGAVGRVHLIVTGRWF